MEITGNNGNNNCCLYSLKKKHLICIKLSVISIFDAIFLFILKLKNLNTVLHNCIQKNPILTIMIFYFCHNALMHGFKCFINV